MAPTYLGIQLHIIFATKVRTPWLGQAWRPRLFEYIGGTLKGLGCKPRIVGGYDDHIHILVGIPATICVADLVRDVKRASNGWIQEEQRIRDFAWQVGYAALSVSASNVETVRAYIANQDEHHRTKSSLDELRELLAEAGVEYDPRFFE